MTPLATILSIASGLALTCYHGPPATVIGTALMIDAALAPLTAVIAARRGRSVIPWTIAGLILGAWALGAIMIMRPVRSNPPNPKPPGYPPTSDAA
ncbi:MAG: hypothetical protein ACREQI_11410 [Candidatus Binataceae bacterium]